MKLIRNFLSFFKTRNQLVAEFERLEKVADLNVSNLTKSLESLEQDEIYLVSCEDMSFESLMALKDALDAASKRLAWTSPPMIFMNKEVQKLSVINRKYAEILIYLELEEKDLKECSKKVDMNYHHLHHVMQRFEKKGLVKRKKHSGVYNFFLTEQGIAVVNDLKSLIQNLTNWTGTLSTEDLGMIDPDNGESKMNEGGNENGKTGHQTGTDTGKAGSPGDRRS